VRCSGTSPWLLALSLGVAAPAADAAPLAHRAVQVIEVGSHPVSVTLEEQGATVIIAAECLIPREPQAVWRILSDYDHLQEFVPFLTSSRVIGREADALILRQEGRAGLLGFQRRFTVTFRVQERPPSDIRFDSVAGDFTRFSGRWHLERRP